MNGNCSAFYVYELNPVYTWYAHLTYDYLMIGKIKTFLNALNSIHYKDYSS